MWYHRMSLATILLWSNSKIICTRTEGEIAFPKGYARKGFSALALYMMSRRLAIRCGAAIFTKIIVRDQPNLDAASCTSFVKYVCSGNKSLFLHFALSWVKNSLIITGGPLVFRRFLVRSEDGLFTIISRAARVRRAVCVAVTKALSKLSPTVGEASSKREGNTETGSLNKSWSMNSSKSSFSVVLPPPRAHSISMVAHGLAGPVLNGGIIPQTRFRGMFVRPGLLG